MHARTFVRTCIHTHMHACMHACMHTNIQAYKHINILTHTWHPHKVSTVRVCVNAYGNLYWMYTLYRGIAAARRKHFASHRRWMLRNFSVAVAIIFGRYVGTVPPPPPPFQHTTYFYECCDLAGTLVPSPPSLSLHRHTMYLHMNLHTYVGAAQGRSPCFPCPSRGGATPTPSRHSTLSLAGSSPSPVSSSTSSDPRLLLPQKPKSSDARGHLCRTLVRAPGVWGEGRGWSGRGGGVRGGACGESPTGLGRFPWEIHACCIHYRPSKRIFSLLGSRVRGVADAVCTRW